MQRVNGREELHTEFWRENLRERSYLEDVGIYGMMILKKIFKKLDGGVDWNDLAEDRKRWQAFVNGVIRLQVPYVERNFLTR